MIVHQVHKPKGEDKSVPTWELPSDLTVNPLKVKKVDTRPYTPRTTWHGKCDENSTETLELNGFFQFDPGPALLTRFRHEAAVGSW